MRTCVWLTLLLLGGCGGKSTDSASPATGGVTPTSGSTAAGSTATGAPTGSPTTGTTSEPDSDGDGVPDSADPCPLDNPDDSDADGVCDSDDLCPGEDDAACDFDGDGFAPNTGDCCETTADCTAPELVNPNAADVGIDIGEAGVDDDCNGTVDDPPAPCDAGLALDATDPLEAAAAVGLCDSRFLNGATWTRANGLPASSGLHTGLLDAFGTNNQGPWEGSRMLGLSSGYARDANGYSGCGGRSCTVMGAGTPPPGFPSSVPGCDIGGSINDDIALELDLVAPSNATGFRVSYQFFTFEWAEYICTTFNDQFVALVDPPPLGSIDGNVAFDGQGIAPSVNHADLDVCNYGSLSEFAYFCDPVVSVCPAPPVPSCIYGDSELLMTGFAEWDTWGGATPWLESRSPVAPGQTVRVRLAIWDTDDSGWDSTVLIDDFQWITSPGVITETTVR